MARIKVAEATNGALDWMVATCESRALIRNPMGPQGGHGWWIWEEVPNDQGGILTGQSIYMEVGPRLSLKTRNSGERYSPSTDWARGGPIIERELIAIDWSEGNDWCASCDSNPTRVFSASTPLIAAMRCFVASKLGDEVDVPQELV